MGPTCSYITRSSVNPKASALATAISKTFFQTGERGVTFPCSRLTFFWGFHCFNHFFPNFLHKADAHGQEIENPENHFLQSYPGCTNTSYPLEKVSPSQTTETETLENDSNDKKPQKEGKKKHAFRVFNSAHGRKNKEKC